MSCNFKRLNPIGLTVCNDPVCFLRYTMLFVKIAVNRTFKLKLDTLKCFNVFFILTTFYVFIFTFYVFIFKRFCY